MAVSLAMKPKIIFVCFCVCLCVGWLVGFCLLFWNIVIYYFQIQIQLRVVKHLK